MNYTIKEEYNDKYVLDYCQKELNMSRSEISALKKKPDGIVLNGCRVTVRAVLKKNDCLSLKREDSTEEENRNIVPTYIPIDIIYEDSDIIAVNKPYGMPTHPSRLHFDDTLANALAYYFKAQDIPFVFRAVNRLDRDTSGVVIVAKNKASAYFLSSEMANGGFQKKYTAIVSGHITKPGVIIKNIKRKNESIIERTVCDPEEGQYCETQYEPIASDGKLTVLSVWPKTGRTHQIRVHLSSCGYAICGDSLYNGNTEIIKRQALHCSSITFKHPQSKKSITVVAELHNDIKNLFEEISKKNIKKDYTDE